MVARLAGAAVAATDASSGKRHGWGSVIAAALAIPGISAAQTELVQGQSAVGIKWMNYRDWQPGLDRIRVNSPAFWVSTPINNEWNVEGTATLDSLSGASPRYHTAVSGASRMSDERRAGDVKITRIADRSSWSVGVAASNENDYRSRAISGQARWSTEDNNRTWNMGVGVTSDRIGSTDAPSLDERRRTVELTAGVTQALSRADLVQLAVTYAAGKGYYSDSYKSPDYRPDFRNRVSVTLRWNHHLENWDTTLRSSYRIYRDSFGVRSHTVSLESVVSLGPRFQITPSIRLYTQDAARFYYNPIYSYTGTPYPADYSATSPPYISADQRLSAFGAIALGLKFAVQLGDGWTADIKLERYQQRSGWHLIQPGSRGLAPFSASYVQWGLMRQF